MLNKPQAVPSAWLAVHGTQPASQDIAAIDDALEALAHVDPRKEKVVELRVFGGLSVDERAAVLEISPRSVMRDGKMVRAWLIF